MRTLIVTLTTCLFVLPVQAKYSGGSGEPNDPYLISTAADLIALGETPSDYDKHFLLTANIDLDPNLPGRKVFDEAVIAPDADATKTYFQGTPFTGVFDGNGHTISNLTIIGGSYLGLFGQLDYRAEVKNLGLPNVNINGSGGEVGGLVGYNWGGSVTKCDSTGGVRGKYDVGGLVGWGNGTVTQCYSTGTVSGDSNIGGLVGTNVGTIVQCHSSSSVTGTNVVGGLVGVNNDGDVTDCYSTAKVAGRSSVGGLVGWNWYDYEDGGATLATCYSTGAVSGESSVGGLVGKDSNGTVTQCFWDAQTSGRTWSAGGTGKTTAEMQDPNTFITAGWGFAPHDIWIEPEGDGYPILWWQLSPLPEPPVFSGGTGEPNDPYRISTPAELNSIGHNPRLMGAHFKLVNDIDLKDVDFYIIGGGSYSFTGSFDGNGHTISHLTIQGGDALGLFGRLASPAEVKNLGVVDVNITGSGLGVGGLVGVNYGTVRQCHSTGTVSGGHYGIAYGTGGLVGYNTGALALCRSAGVVTGGSSVGGLVGYNTGALALCCSAGVVTGGWSVGGLVGHNWEGSVTSCHSSGAVSATRNDVGGLVGYNSYGSIGTSYSTGAVTGAGYFVGGLVGYNTGFVTQCYSTGAVSGTSSVGGLVAGGSVQRATACFWDTETSGQAASAGGTGKTTAEMQTAKTFLDAGWNFVGETTNGTEDIWWILEGKDYPRLWWEAHN